MRYVNPSTPSTRRDSNSRAANDSRGRYVRIEEGGRSTDRNSPVVDLSDARPEKRSRASFPSVSNARRGRDRSTPSKRFAPVEGESLRPQLDRLREDRLRNSTRTGGNARVTRDSILERYRQPTAERARERSALDARAAARDADRAALRRSDDIRRRTEERRRAAETTKNSNRARDAARTASSQAARAAARDASRSTARLNARDQARRESRKIERRNIANETARQRLAQVDRLNAKDSKRVIDRSIATARAVDRSVQTSIQASFGAFGGGFGGGFAGYANGGGYGGWYGDFSNPAVCSNWLQNCYWPSWNSWYYGSGLWCPFGSRSGFGFGGFGRGWGGGFGWGGGWGNGWGFGFGYRSRNFNFCYQPFWNTWSLYQPFSSWYCPRPIYYTSLWIDNTPQVAAAPAEEEEWIEEAPIGEGWVDEGAAPVQVGGTVSGGGTFVDGSSTAQSEALSRAASHYLTVGDRAFREARYGDAVHFYAKAVEFSPDDGVLFLILSDALFATGDYHYGAYALRRALELDPTLTESVVDKHSFYTDEREFDRQLAVLEEYLEDHFLDDDARLLLAANYLFGGRPAAAVDLLSSAFSKGVAESQAGALILATAQVIQYGESETK